MTLLTLMALALLWGCGDLGEEVSVRDDAFIEGDAGGLGGGGAGGGRPDFAFGADMGVGADRGVDPELDMGMQPDADPGADARVDPPDMDPVVQPDMGGGMPPVDEPVVYPSDRTLSPVTPFVAERWRAIAGAEQQQGDVFAKVGASATVSFNFLHCFGGDPGRIDLDGRGDLQATLDHFRGGDARGTDSFRRESLAATVGWSARTVIAGDPAPLEEEVDAIDPRFAVVMYGTNDIQFRTPFRYADSMLTLTDRLIARGVIPALTTVMPRDDNAEADTFVPLYNAIIRGVAQARQVPFIDYHRELDPLPDHGLGGDNLHPSVYRNGGPRGCVLNEAGLQAGYNIRNLITLQTLDRLRRVVVANEAAPDARAPVRQGAGIFADPYVIDGLPFTDLRDTTQQGERRLDRYTGCNANQDESGPEVVYRLDLQRPTVVSAYVFDRGDTDIDVHLLDATGEAAGCLERNDGQISVSLDPGTWFFVLDTFVARAGPRPGEFLFVLIEGAP